MRGHSAGTAYRREETIPYVEIWQQPFLRWLASQAYHMWEKASWRLIRLLFERWHKAMFGRGDDFYIPLTNRQDLRCYELTQKKRTCLAVIYVTQQQYDIITGKMPAGETPRHESKQPITIDPEVVET